MAQRVNSCYWKATLTRLFPVLWHYSFCCHRHIHQLERSAVPICRRSKKDNGKRSVFRKVMDDQIILHLSWHGHRSVFASSSRWTQLDTPHPSGGMIDRSLPDLSRGNILPALAGCASGLFRWSSMVKMVAVCLSCFHLSIFVSASHSEVSGPDTGREG